MRVSFVLSKVKMILNFFFKTIKVSEAYDFFSIISFKNQTTFFLNICVMLGLQVNAWFAMTF